MSKQCLSIEQMEHLKEIGVNVDNASFCVNTEHEDKHIFTYDTYYSLIEYSCETQPVFTLQDILDLLPVTVKSDYFGVQDTFYLDLGASEVNKQNWFVQYCSSDGGCYQLSENKELIDAAYEMLCWCIENGYVETDKEK